MSIRSCWEMETDGTEWLFIVKCQEMWFIASWKHCNRWVWFLFCVSSNSCSFYLYIYWMISFISFCCQLRLVSNIFCSQLVSNMQVLMSLEGLDVREGSCLIEGTSFCKIYFIIYTDYIFELSALLKWIMDFYWLRLNLYTFMGKLHSVISSLRCWFCGFQIHLWHWSVSE